MAVKLASRHAQSGSVVATWPSSAKGEWRVSSWLAKLTRGKNTIFFHMRCYGFSQGRKSLYNTAVYVIKCFISNIRKNSAIDISPAKLSIGWFALGGEREIREARKSGVWRNQRRKSGPWWTRSTRNGRQRSFSPLTQPSKCRVGRWGAILYHSSYNARVFAARHLVNNMNETELRNFVSENLKNGKWQLVF